MMNYTVSTFNSEAQMIVRFLLVWSWQALLVMGAVWLGLKISRARHPDLRYKFWLCGMIIVLLFPLAVVIEHLIPISRQSSLTPPSSLITPVYFLSSTTILHTPKLSSPVVSSDWSLSQFSWTVLFFCWLTGFLLACIHYALAYRKVLLARRSIRMVTVPEIIGVTAEVFSKTDLRIGLSSEVCSPVLLGLLRPMILLPIDILDWSTEEERAAIVRHEMAHYRRRDHWVNPVQLLLSILFYFHPVMRYAFRQMNLEREASCDMEVLLSGTSREVYAGSLIKVIEKTLHQENTHAFAPFASRSTVLRRIELIMDGTLTKELRRGPRRWLLLAMIMLLGGVAYLCIPQRPVSSAAPIKTIPSIAQTDKPGGLGQTRKIESDPVRIRVDPWVISSIAEIHPRFAATLAQLTRDGLMERQSKSLWPPVEIKKEEVLWWTKPASEAASFMREFAARKPESETAHASSVIAYETRVEGISPESSAAMIFIKAEQKPLSIDPPFTLLRVDLMRDNADHELWTVTGFGVDTNRERKEVIGQAGPETAIDQQLKERVNKWLAVVQNESKGSEGHHHYWIGAATERIDNEQGEAYLGLIGDMSGCRVTIQPLVATGPTIDNANLKETGEEMQMVIGGREKDVVTDASYISTLKFNATPQANAIRIVFTPEGDAAQGKKLELILDLENSVRFGVSHMMTGGAAATQGQ